MAIGLSASGITSANLQTSGQVWLLIRQAPRLDDVNGEYELRAGGATGTVLASGTLTLDGYTPVSLRYDPIARAVGAVLNGNAVGPFDAPGVAPSSAVIEGQGVSTTSSCAPCREEAPAAAGVRRRTR